MATRNYLVLFGALFTLLVMGFVVFYVWKTQETLNLLQYVPGSATRVVYFNPHTVWGSFSTEKGQIIKEINPDFFLEQTSPLQSFMRANAQEIVFFYTPLSSQSPGVIIKTNMPEELLPPQGFAFQFEFGTSAVYKRRRAHTRTKDGAENAPSEYYAYLPKQKIVIKSFRLQELLEMVNKPVRKDPEYSKLLKSEIFRYGVKNFGSFQSVFGAPNTLSAQDNTLRYVRIFMRSPDSMQFYRGDDPHFSHQSIDRVRRVDVPKNLVLWAQSPNALPLLYMLLVQKDHELEQFTIKQVQELFGRLGMVQELSVFKNDEPFSSFHYVVRLETVQNSSEEIERQMSSFLGNMFIFEQEATLKGGLEVVELHAAEEAFMWREEQVSQGHIRFVRVEGAELAYLKQGSSLWLSDSSAFLKTALSVRNEFLSATATTDDKTPIQSILFISTHYAQELAPDFKGLAHFQHVFMWENQIGELFGVIRN